MVVGNNMQAVFGTKSVNIKTDMEEFLRSGAQAELPKATPKESSGNSNFKMDPKKVIEALGGLKNIKEPQLCAVTRIRVKLSKVDLINEPALRKAGVKDILKLEGGVVHLVFTQQQASKMIDFFKKNS